MIVRFLITCVFVLAVSGCTKNFHEDVDRTLFALKKQTVFSKHKKVTIKQLQFETNILADKIVSFDGVIDELGDGHTYLVAKHQGVKILVKMTNMHGKSSKLNEHKNKQVSVLGVVKYGVGGLPLVEASAISFL